jgi:hypothetical protein
MGRYCLVAPDVTAAIPFCCGVVSAVAAIFVAVTLPLTSAFLTAVARACASVAAAVASLVLHSPLTDTVSFELLASVLMIAVAAVAIDFDASADSAEEFAVNAIVTGFGGVAGPSP